MAEGRLFTLSREPVAADERCEVGECWFNASVLADRREDAVYVEGHAMHGGAMQAAGLSLPHAWCATDRAALEPTEGWGAPVTYLGVPFSDEFRRHLHQRHGVGSLAVGLSG